MNIFTVEHTGNKMSSIAAKKQKQTASNAEILDAAVCGAKKLCRKVVIVDKEYQEVNGHLCKKYAVSLGDEWSFRWHLRPGSQPGIIVVYPEGDPNDAALFVTLCGNKWELNDCERTSFDSFGDAICALLSPAAESSAEEPGAEEPGAEEPGAEEPGAEEPGAAEPGASAP